MNIVKTSACLAAFFCLVPLLAGCGGADNPTVVTTRRYIPVTLALNWNALAADAVIPGTETTRATSVPANAFSVQIRLTDLSVTAATENDLVTVATINRSTTTRSAYNQTFTTTSVVARPNVSSYVEVRAFSGLNGTGTLIASEKKLREPIPRSGDLGEFTLTSPVP